MYFPSAYGAVDLPGGTTNTLGTTPGVALTTESDRQLDSLRSVLAEMEAYEAMLKERLQLIETRQAGARSEAGSK